LCTLFICRTFAAEIGNEITGIKFIKYLFSLVSKACREASPLFIGVLEDFDLSFWLLNRRKKNQEKEPNFVKLIKKSLIWKS